jgi:ketosteroid isomerase-like protein
MSQENVELVREGFAAWERGDIEAIIEFSDPEIEIIQPSEVPDSKSYRGHAGVREAFEDWPKQWEEFRAELLDVIDVSETQTISLTRHHLRARGIDMDQEVAYLYTFRDGLVIRCEMYLTRAEALEAAGLRE